MVNVSGREKGSKSVKGVGVFMYVDATPVVRISILLSKVGVGKVRRLREFAYAADSTTMSKLVAAHSPVPCRSMLSARQSK